MLLCKNSRFKKFCLFSFVFGLFNYLYKINDLGINQRLFIIGRVSRWQLLSGAILGVIRDVILGVIRDLIRDVILGAIRGAIRGARRFIIELQQL